MIASSDDATWAGRARAGMPAENDGSLPHRQPGLTVLTALAVLAAAAIGLAGCGVVHRRPAASVGGKAAHGGSTLPPGLRPPAGLVPDVTLAYFQHGVGLVGIAPLGGGWQSDKPSTLWLTTGSGQWRAVTPPGARRAAPGGYPSYPIFEAASFLNPTTGWVITWAAANDSGTMYGTHDGGASWTVVGYGGHSQAAGAADLIQLVTPRVAFSETLEPTAPGMGLQVTTDGGHFWHTVYTVPPFRSPGTALAGPFEMPMVFVSPSRGFAADGIPPADSFVGEGDFFTTSDGGRNWVRQSPPMAGPSSVCTRSPGTPAPCYFGLPVFTSATRGVVPSEVLTRTGATVGFDATTSGGNAWTLASTLHVPLARRSVTASPPAGYAFVALPSARTWWVLAAAQRGVTSWVSTDSGHNWPATTDATVPGIPVALQAIDASHAWLTTVIDTPGGSSQELYATSDAGRHWQEVHPG